jgi:hypothetical protein
LWPLFLLAGGTGGLFGFVCFVLTSLIAVNDAKAESPLPDLAVESVAPSPELVDEGQSVRWRVTVKNLGSGASGVYYAAMDDDENPGTKPIQEKPMKSLAANETGTVTFERIAKRGETLYFYG